MGAIYDIFHVRSINKSTNEITDFGVYGSKSELGILRLASIFGDKKGGTNTNSIQSQLHPLHAFAINS